jgi:hypothetical protein
MGKMEEAVVAYFKVLSHHLNEGTGQDTNRSVDLELKSVLQKQEVAGV